MEDSLKTALKKVIDSRKTTKINPHFTSSAFPYFIMRFRLTCLLIGHLPYRSVHDYHGDNGYTVDMFPMFWNPMFYVHISLVTLLVILMLPIKGIHSWFEYIEELKEHINQHNTYVKDGYVFFIHRGMFWSFYCNYIPPSLEQELSKIS